MGRGRLGRVGGGGGWGVERNIGGFSGNRRGASCRWCAWASVWAKLSVPGWLKVVSERVTGDPLKVV